MKISFSATLVQLALSTASAQAPAGITCPNLPVNPIEPGLTEVSDPTLLAKALGPVGDGGLCNGKVYKVTGTMFVYRAFDTKQGKEPWHKFGHWWNFSRPPKGKTFYRDDVVCPEYNSGASAKHRQFFRCTLKMGVNVAVGPGDSAKCSAGNILPRSPVMQIYVDNDTRHNKVLVTDCQPAVNFPTAGLTSTPAPATLRPTSTPAPATLRPTSTAAPATLRPTSTPAPAALRPTPTPAPAALRPTSTPAPATRRPTSTPAPASKRGAPAHDHAAARGAAGRGASKRDASKSARKLRNDGNRNLLGKCPPAGTSPLECADVIHGCVCATKCNCWKNRLCC